jgi:predicted lipoprotein with Yx(FWY)xxD motif
MLRLSNTFIISGALLSILSACGGGGKSSSGYSPTPDYSYSSSSSSSTSRSSSSSVAMSSSFAISSAISSSSSTAVATEAPIDRLTTNMGSALIAKGSVDVLVVNGADLTVQSQNKNNLTLYIFDKDAPGQSACTSSQCITTWSPLLAKVSDVAHAPLSIITRADGKPQWAMRNKPLYFYKGDSKAGDINGEGIGTIWHVALSEPVLLNKASVNALDGDYLMSSGNVLVGMPSGDNSKFMAERHDRDGFSLYTFDNDTDGVSNCTAACLAVWPPLLADGNDLAAAPYSIIDRNMGTNPTAKQWAYHGMPLYYYGGDSLAGQTNGKIIPKWHLARPLPFTVKDDPSLSNILVASGLVKSAATVNGIEKTSVLARTGFTLYTFDNDTSGTSNCTGTCLANWPALIAHEGAIAHAPYALITRASGEKQWAINGMPLYFFSGDIAAGDTNGEGFVGKWFVARGLPVAVNNNTTKGKLFIAHGNLINANGNVDTTRANFTLYSFDKDTAGSGKSTCNGSCLVTWPALYAPADAKAFGDFGVIVRDTGEKQWSYDGKPLYFYIGDSVAGDVNGEYPNWIIARP